jgi:hypothetical protein
MDVLRAGRVATHPIVLARDGPAGERVA